jgi:hypothetical protein
VTARANVEQNYFNEHFGAFYRINTFYLLPNDDADKGHDLFTKPYLELMYILMVSASPSSPSTHLVGASLSIHLSILTSLSIGSH